MEWLGRTEGTHLGPHTQEFLVLLVVLGRLLKLHYLASKGVWDGPVYLQRTVGQVTALH